MPAATPDGFAVAAASHSSKTNKPKTGGKGDSGSKPYKPATNVKPSYVYYPEGVRDAEQQLAEAVAAATENTVNLDYLKQDDEGGTDWTRYKGPSMDAGSQQLDELAMRDPAVVSAQAAVDRAVRAERTRAIGMDKDKSPGPQIKKNTYVMSPAKYESLKPLQRAAVDFNTDLVQAIRRDRKLQDTYEFTDDRQKEYDASLEKMFGAGNDQGLVAPLTLEVLEGINFSDKAASLDDFLQLKAAITTKDLKGLTPKAQNAPVNPVQQTYSPEPGKPALAESREKLVDALAQGNEWRIERDEQPAEFDSYLQYFGQKGADVPGLLSSLKKSLLPGQWKQFTEYSQAYLSNNTEYPNATEGTEYVPTEDALRKLSNALAESRLRRTDKEESDG